MSTDHQSQVAEPELERQGKRIQAPGFRELLLGLAIATCGVVLLVVGQSWVWAIGIALAAVSIPFITVGVGALLAALVARWSSRHKSFA